MRRIIKQVCCPLLSFTLLNQCITPALIYAQEEIIEQESSVEEVSADDLLERIESIEIEQDEKEVSIIVSILDDDSMENLVLNIKGDTTIQLKTPKQDDNKYIFTDVFEEGSYIIQSLSLDYNDERYQLNLSDFEESAFVVSEFVSNKEEEISVENEVPDHTAYYNRSYTLSGNKATDMVAVARAQVDTGQTEESLGFASDYAWCAAFVCDVARLAGVGIDVIPYHNVNIANVNDMWEQMTEYCGATVVYDRQPGDLVFYYCRTCKRFRHVGIVENSETSLEGNCCIDGVWRTTRSYGFCEDDWHSTKDNIIIMKYLRPNYKDKVVLDESEFAQKMYSLRDEFKNGYYFDYVNGTTNIGNVTYAKVGPNLGSDCKSGKCARDCSCDCGSVYVGGDGYAWQGHGFGNVLGFGTFGTISNLWGSGSADNLFAGDVVRLYNDTLTIFITKIDGETVYYTDCNVDGPCQVSWDKTTTLTEIRNNVTRVWHYDGNSCKGTSYSPLAREIKIDSVQLNKTSLTLEKGTSQTLSVTISPANTTESKTITWSSSNTSVATVSNGVVTAVGKGTCVITAKTSNGKTATCSVTVSDPTGKVEGYSLSLSGDIGVKFYMTLSNDIISDSSTYVLFSLPNGTSSKVMVKDASVVNSYYVFPCYVSAKDMTGTITARLYKSGSVVGDYSYTVEDYADYIMDHYGSSTKEYKIAKAMLTYGYYAQKYFGYNTSSLPTNINSLSNVDLDFYEYLLKDTNNSVSFAGAKLVLKSKPRLKLYFKGTGTFKVDGTVVSTTTEENYTVITISDIDDMTNEYQITTDNFRLLYGIFSYGNSAMNSGSTSLKNLVKAMYAYNQAINS